MPMSETDDSVDSIIRAVPMDELVARTCEPQVLDAFDDLVWNMWHTRYHFGCLISPRLAARLPIPGDSWTRIREYCDVRLGHDLFPAAHMVELLIRLYQPDGVGAWIGPGMLMRLEPGLSFSADGLLDGPVDNIEFRNDAVLTKAHALHYREGLPAGSTDTFVAELVNFARSNVQQVDYLALAVDRDAALDRSYYDTMVTRAYIRGPIGLSPLQLFDENFPGDPSGVVTEHMRVTRNPLQELLCPLVRTEIMWSRRSGMKTVQIEELAPPCQASRISRERTANRYVHARWDPSQGVFVHLDGALRSYAEDEYKRRLSTDLKKADKASRYHKLFRIDGRLSVKVWSTLVGKFFADNELVMEYLGGPEEQSQ